MKTTIALLIAATSVADFTITQAGEIGHYNGGVIDRRDYFNTRLSLANEPGGSLNNSSFDVGNIFSQPLWLDWGLNHWDFSLAYGTYAPAGRYNMQKVAWPNSMSVTVGSANNIGPGYWTQQAQAGIVWYPMTNKETAFTAIGTYEYESDQQDSDIRPGQMITLNWGVSQYFPLSKHQKLLLEVGPAGYDSYEITDSTGANALTANPKSQVHAVGGQFGLAYVPWSAFVTVHGFYEYAAESRFQGVSIGLNFGIKF